MRKKIAFKIGKNPLLKDYEPRKPNLEETEILKRAKEIERMRSPKGIRERHIREIKDYYFASSHNLPTKLANLKDLRKKTSDPKVMKVLDDFIERIEGWQQKQKRRLRKN